MTLDQLPTKHSARIVAIDWSRLAGEEAQRLRALGIDEGARVAVAYRGIMGGRDPLAITIGRMTVALRRVHAQAMEVELIEPGKAVAAQPARPDPVTEPALPQAEVA